MNFIVYEEKFFPSWIAWQKYHFKEAIENY